MRDIRIFIPTKGRSDKQVTADQLRAADIPYELVCSADDTQKNIVRYMQTAEVEGHIADVSSISEKRQWILRHCRKSKLVMLDDDLVFYARISDSKFVKANPKQLRAMFAWISDSLDSYAHCGIVDKFMSNATPRGYVLSRRYNSVLAYNPEFFPSPPPRFRIPVSEEHDVHLQLATQGLPPIVSTEWSKSTSYYNPGGCTGERTKKSEAEGHKRFAALWPDLVKVVPHKTNISGLAIRVQWAKAAKL